MVTEIDFGPPWPLVNLLAALKLAAPGPGLAVCHAVGVHLAAVIGGTAHPVERLANHHPPRPSQLAPAQNQSLLSRPGGHALPALIRCLHYTD